MDTKKLIKKLEKYPEVSAAILHGSQATGHARQESDIDLAILFTKVFEPLDLLAFQQELSDEMHVDVDVVVLNTASPIIAMQAVKNGRPLFIKDKKAYQYFEINLITDYADLKKLREPFEKNILQRKLHG